MTSHPKKLIEVALPLEEINVASAREKSIRHGHPSTLHLWWARRPLAAARAVLFGQLVDDPSGYVEELRRDPEALRPANRDLKERLKVWREKKATHDQAVAAGIARVVDPGTEPTLDEVLVERERERLFALIRQLVQWENTTNESVLEPAREEIRRSWRRTCRRADQPEDTPLPAFHDPFAGGGAIPLEAQRLGLEAHASDLNPVAVLINKAMIEIPPKFAGRPPVNPGNAGILPALGKGWHSRGYLPHFDQPELIQSVTFRLHDSVPVAEIERWKEELAWRQELAADHPAVVELRRKIEKFEDAGHGECHLRNPQIAELVQDALLHFDGERYRLIAWCIMPNHVHVLIETLHGYPLGDVVHSWKSFSAKEANKLLGRSGPFWMEDYHDRFIRDANHLANVTGYIHQNPVKAGLVAAAGDWAFSSLGARASSPPESDDDAGGTPAFPGLWRGAQGLAEDVRYYGKWMREEAEKRIGDLYPKIEVTAEMAQERPDLKPLVGQKLTVIAWLWARTVKSPNLAFADVDVPLASTFMLSTKAGKEAWVEPVVENGGIGLWFTKANHKTLLPRRRGRNWPGEPTSAV